MGLELGLLTRLGLVLGLGLGLGLGLERHGRVRLMHDAEEGRPG